MATTRPLPRRVASPAFMTTPAHPPRPWPNLPAETQAQIALVLAALLRRMPAAHMLTASNAPDERLSAAHRARLAYIYVRQSSLNQVRTARSPCFAGWALMSKVGGVLATSCQCGRTSRSLLESEGMLSGHGPGCYRHTASAMSPHPCGRQRYVLARA